MSARTLECPPWLQAASTASETVVNALRSVAAVLGCSDQFNTSSAQRQASFSESDAWETGLSSNHVLSMATLSRLK